MQQGYLCKGSIQQYQLPWKAFIPETMRCGPCDCGFLSHGNEYVTAAHSVPTLLEGHRDRTFLLYAWGKTWSRSDFISSWKRLCLPRRYQKLQMPVNLVDLRFFFHELKLVSVDNMVRRWGKIKLNCCLTHNMGIQDSLYLHGLTESDLSRSQYELLGSAKMVNVWIKI